jgi:effector-binding domain-containing protein
MNIRIVHANTSTNIADWNSASIVNVMNTLKNHANMNDVARSAQNYTMITHAQRQLKDENASTAMKIILFNRFNAK